MHPGTWAQATPDRPARVMAYGRERIAYFTVPRELILTDDLPRFPTGELVKGRLTVRYAEAAAR